MQETKGLVNAKHTNKLTIYHLYLYSIVELLQIIKSDAIC